MKTIEVTVVRLVVEIGSVVGTGGVVEIVVSGLEELRRGVDVVIMIEDNEVIPVDDCEKSILLQRVPEL